MTAPIEEQEAKHRRLIKNWIRQERAAALPLRRTTPLADALEQALRVVDIADVVEGVTLEPGHCALLQAWATGSEGAEAQAVRWLLGEVGDKDGGRILSSEEMAEIVERAREAAGMQTQGDLHRRPRADVLAGYNDERRTVPDHVPRDSKLLALLDAARELVEDADSDPSFRSHALDALEAAARTWAADECPITARDLSLRLARESARTTPLVRRTCGAARARVRRVSTRHGCTRPRVEAEGLSLMRCKSYGRFFRPDPRVGGRQKQTNSEFSS